MSELATTSLSSATINSILSQALRNDLARIIAGQDAAAQRSDAQIDDRIDALQAEVNALRRAGRRNDFTPVSGWLTNAAATLSLTLPDDIPVSLGRAAIDLMRDTREIEMRVTDGEDAVRLAEVPAARFTCAPVRDFIRPPLVLSEVLEATYKFHPTPSMKSTIKGTGTLCLEFFGDVPVDLLTHERQLDFFAFVSRLPITQGKKHGKNRYTSVGTPVTKLEEIEQADAWDEVATENIRTLPGLSVKEKQARLAEVLTPRLTMQTILKHRNNLARMIRAAQSRGAPQSLKVPSYRDIATHLASLVPEDELYVRVTKPKTRMPWTEERLARFLMSPIYTGCFSEHRRWRPGNLIIRDATYWVPLIVMSIGSRIEEILQLRKNSICRRNNVLCIKIGLGSDQRSKGPESVRYVPIPQLLLDLGFDEWWRSLPEGSVLLFPEAAARSSTGILSGVFGKHFSGILAHLGLRDFDEDFYALRKTLLTLLSDADVSDGQRQAIAGHKHGNILNLHYTAQKTKILKRALDKVQFGIVIEMSTLHGFPVISECTLAKGDVLEVEVEIGDDGQATLVQLKAAGSAEAVFAVRVGNQGDCDTCADTGLAQMPRREAAARMNAFIGDSTVKLPRHPRRVAAFECLAAMA